MGWKISSVLALGAFAIALSSCVSSPPATSISDISETAYQNSADAPEKLSEGHNLSVETNLDEQGRALRGYDPVAYFIEGKATPGQTKFSLLWNDSEWLFSSLENRDIFLKKPEQYAPANGGFCTFGVVLGKKLDGDPEVWSLLNGYLYIFLNEEVREKFFQDEVGNLQKVMENWPQIKEKAPEDLG